MRSRSLCTMSNCSKALIIVWAVALILASPVISTRDTYKILFYNNYTNVTVYYCTEEDNGFVVAVFQLATMFVIPLILMCFCYARVIKELWISTKKMSAMTRVCSTSRFDSRSSISIHMRISVQHSPDKDSIGRVARSISQRLDANQRQGTCDDVKQARKQVIKMLILVIFLFLICWGPRLIMDAIIKYGLDNYSDIIYNLRVTFHLLPFVHSCLNPIIYSFMSSNFRRSMVHFCTHQGCAPVVSSVCCGGTDRQRRQRRGLYELGISSSIDFRQNQSTSSQFLSSNNLQSFATRRTSPSSTAESHIYDCETTIQDLHNLHEAY